MGDRLRIDVSRKRSEMAGPGASEARCYECISDITGRITNEQRGRERQRDSLNEPARRTLGAQNIGNVLFELGEERVVAGIATSDRS